MLVLDYKNYRATFFIIYLTFEAILISFCQNLTKLSEENNSSLNQEIETSEFSISKEGKEIKFKYQILKKELYSNLEILAR